MWTHLSLTCRRVYTGLMGVKDYANRIMAAEYDEIHDDDGLVNEDPLGIDDGGWMFHGNRLEGEVDEDDKVEVNCYLLTIHGPLGIFCRVFIRCGVACLHTMLHCLWCSFTCLHHHAALVIGSSIARRGVNGAADIHATKRWPSIVCPMLLALRGRMFGGWCTHYFGNLQQFASFGAKKPSSVTLRSFTIARQLNNLQRGGVTFGGT